MKTGKRIVEYLNARKSEAHIATLCAEMGIPRGAAVASLQWLVQNGTVVRPSRGHYSTVRQAGRPATKAIEPGNAFGLIPMSRLMAGK